MTYCRALAVLIVVSAAGCYDDDECYYAQGAPTEDIGAYELRDPTTGSCQAFGGGCDCIDPCGPCPPCEGQPQPDWAQCNSACETLDENRCKTTAGCRAAYAGGTFYQCWSVAPSGPIQGGDCTTYDAYTCSRHDDCVALHATGSPIGSFLSCAGESSAQDPGSCVGVITCSDPKPGCPSDTLPGRRNGCWTGYCIPTSQCDALPACSELGEMDCIGRSDCAPTYVGHNCTCNGTSCTCQSWVFETCKMR